MEIDPTQLPVPHWNLACPDCGYSLNGLPTHRCPECGREFDVQSLLASWSRIRDPRFTGSERPVPELGLRCEGCDVPLAGAEGDLCPACGKEMRIEALVPKGDWFTINNKLRRGVPAPVISLALEDEQIPFLTIPHYNPFFVLPDRCFVPTEFYFDVLWLIDKLLCKQEERASRREEDGPESEWTCRSCGEENPDNFETCWNCGGH